MSLDQLVKSHEERIEKIFEELEKSKEDTRKSRHAFDDATQQLKGVYSIYNDLKKDYDELKAQNKSQADNIRLLLSALNDNPLTQEKGLISRLKDVEEFMKWVKEKKAVATGYMLGASIVISFLAGIWVLLKWAWSHIMIH